MEYSPPGSSCPWDSPGKNTGMGCHFFLQEIFLTQGLNLHFLHWQVDSLPLSHLRSPEDLKALYKLHNTILKWWILKWRHTHTRQSCFLPLVLILAQKVRVRCGEQAGEQKSGPDREQWPSFWASFCGTQTALGDGNDAWASRGQLMHEESRPYRTPGRPPLPSNLLPSQDPLCVWRTTISVSFLRVMVLGVSPASVESFLTALLSSQRAGPSVLSFWYHFHCMDKDPETLGDWVISAKPLSPGVLELNLQQVFWPKLREATRWCGQEFYH